MVNIEKETIEDRVPESGLMMSEIAPVLYKERDVLEKEGGSGNRSRKLGAAGLAMLSLLACEGCITGPQARDMLGNLAREMSNAAFDGVRQQTQLGADAYRTELQLKADAVRTKIQRDAQRLRNYDDEIKAANTPEQVKFINNKYGM